MTPFKALFWPTLAATPVLALGLWLGFWQLDRKVEKDTLVEAVSMRALGRATTIPAPGAWAQLDPDLIDFQKVSVEGRFRDGPEFRLYVALSEAKGPLRGPGWFIYQPFDLASGGTVLVNRGFVPESQREISARPASASPPDGVQRLEGLVRRAERVGPFAANDDTARNQWFTRNATKMAASAGLAGVAPFTLEQSTPNPGGLPQAGETRLVFPNRHLEYAITWFGLSATLVGVWGVFVWRRLKLAVLRTDR